MFKLVKKDFDIVDRNDVLNFYYYKHTSTANPMITILKILLVVVLLISMTLVLLMIGHVAHPEDSSTKEDRDRLLHDVETRERVITPNSIFHQFFARSQRRASK